MGTGTPILALHGWSPDHRLMSGCLEPVFARRPGYRRLYPDLPGMGRTPAPPHVSSSDDLLDAVHTYIDTSLGTEPFLLVGESYGGYLARALLNTRADQVRGLALICPVGTQLVHERRRVPARQVLRPDPDLLATLDERTAAGFEEIAVVQSAQTLRRYQEDVEPGLACADRAAMARIQARWELRTAPESGEPYRRPTLILTGRQDDSVGYLDQFDLLAHYPRATFAVLDVAGHNLQFEQPTLFGALLEEWLDRVVAEAPS